jgi:tRNA(Ile)-lysidine synthase
LPQRTDNPTDNIAINGLFLYETARLTHHPNGSIAGRFAIAVSGGPDSMALLMLAHNLAAQHDGVDIIAATVDHQLREESRKEAQMVAAFCKQHDIDHDILHPSAPITGNIQSSARNVRYALLQQWAAKKHAHWLMTAHHADDQLETVLMRLNRGSGVAGMAAIRAYHDGVADNSVADNSVADNSGDDNSRDDGISIIRPLLAISKQQLLDYVAAHDIPYVRDPSNDNRDFDRVKIRQALAECDWLDPVAANRTAQALDQANLALVWAGDYFAKSHLRHHKERAEISPQDLPQDILIRLVFLALQHIRPNYVARGSALERVVAQLQAGQTTTQGNILCKADGDIWHFTLAPPRTSDRASDRASGSQ